MAALKKVVLKSTTVMSLNERFTYLRQPSAASTSGGAAMAVPTAMPNLTSPTARDMAAVHLQHLRPSSQPSNLIHRQPHISPQQYRQQQYGAMRRRQPGIGRRGLDTLAGGYEEEDDSVMSISPRSVESPMRALRSRSDYLLPASARNRRLAAQMERRPAVVAALKLKKRSVRQRLGQPFAPSIKDRLTLGNLRGAGRGRRGVRARSGAGRGTAGRGGVGRGRTTLGNANRRGNLNRSQSRGALNRNNDSGAASVTQTARQGQAFRRPFARGGARRGGAVRTPASTAARFFPGRGRAAWRGGSSFRSRRGVAARRAQRSPRGVRRGARGGRGRGANTTQPTKEELDHQLDEYMAGTRSHLDKELDQYMNQASGDALESWD